MEKYKIQEAFILKYSRVFLLTIPQNDIFQSYLKPLKSMCTANKKIHATCLRKSNTTLIIF